MKVFYILDNVGSTKKDLPPGPRIFWSQYGGYYFKFKDGDGPFKSLTELRKNSPIYKKLQKQDPRRAQKIYSKQFLIHAVHDVLTTEEVEKDLEWHLYDMLNHTLSGKIKKNVSFGVHYFHPDHHKILELIKAPNDKGVWEARIAIKNHQTNKWVEKSNTSTFFPKNWDITMLGFKIHEAYMNKKPLSETKFVGLTHCGISIVFIFEGSKIISLYPLYQ